MSKKILPLIIILLICFSGCSNGFIPAGGKVMYEDGSPLTNGGIAFSTYNFMADAKIQPDGTFKLSSLKPDDGLPPGTYKVTIDASETDTKEKTVYLVDPVFADTATTPLTAEVTSGTKYFVFKVKKPAVKR